MYYCSHFQILFPHLFSLAKQILCLILEILNSVDGEIRKVLLEINNTQEIYPTTNLRFLEAGTNNDTYGSDKNVNINEEVITRLKKPQRKAAIVALEKMKDCQ